MLPLRVRDAVACLENRMFRELFRLSKHSLIYGAGIVATQLVGFVLLPLYTHYLTPSDYGTLEIFVTTLAILGIILPLGVTGGLVMSYYENKDIKSRKTALSTAWLYLTLVSFCFLVLLEVFAGTISSLAFSTSEYTSYFRIVFLAGFLDAGIILALLVLRVKEKSVKYVAIILTRTLLSMGLTIFFVVALQKGILGILLSHLIISGIIYLFLIPHLVKGAGFNFSLTRLKGMVSYGLPYIPSNLAGWVMTMSDRYFLLFLSTGTELGLYSIGYKFGLIVNVIVVAPFMLAYGPFFWSVAKRDNAKKIYSLIFTYFTLISVFVALVISVLAKELIVIVTTPSFYDAHRVVPIIAFSYVLAGSFSLLAAGIGIKKKTKWIPLITGIGATINLGLNYVLIPLYGMIGAAIATVIAYSLLPIGSYLISRRYYVINYEWFRIIKIVIIGGTVYGMSLFVSSDTLTVAIVLKLAILLTYPILLYIFKFYQPGELQKAKEVARDAPSYIIKRLYR